MNIEHIALNVDDPEAMAAWYGEHLGLRILRKVGGEANIHFLIDGADRVVLEIFCHPDSPRTYYNDLHPQQLHVAFAVDDIEAVKQRFLAAGATLDGDVHVMPTGDLLLFLRDPWGLTLQLAKRKKPLR